MLQRGTVARLVRLAKPQPGRNFGCPIRMSSSAKKKPDHYETLGLSRESTQKEIREAYVKLSKKHHPDLGGSSAKFGDLAEAYKILSNESSKKSYDSGRDEATRYNRHGKVEDARFYGSPQAPPAYGSQESEGYYGIRGVKRIPNGMMALICVLVIVVSGCTQMFGLTTVSKRRDDEFKKQTVFYLQQEADVRNEFQNLSRHEAMKLIEERRIENELKRGLVQV